ncbi:hypothetical protein [Neobacillus sp. D3-1R]|uniref:hypothetical protein n=1 Tax=Neobacillus sp. D3-1R TaxID=3445778 RepID=UPI003F9EE0BB
MYLKKRYWIIGGILTIALFLGIFNDKEQTAKQKPLFTDKNIYETNIIKSWKTFKKEYKVTDDVKIDNVSIVLNNKGDFESVKFILVEKDGDSYKTLHHQSCVSCPNLQDDDNTIWSEAVEEWPSYNKILDADTFFEQLQTLNQNMKLTKDNLNAFFQIRTREYSDVIIALPGQYFRIEGDNVNPIKAPSEEVAYKGFNLQIIEGNQQIFQSDENTRNIIITEEKNNSNP